MKQKYSWHFIFLIKFLLSKETDNNKAYLFNLLKKLIGNMQSKSVGLDFCIETDIPINEIISDELDIFRYLEPPYFILIRVNYITNPHENEDITLVRLKDTELFVQLLDLKSSETLADQEDLSNIFSRIVHNVQSDYTSIVTWDHGSGYSIFSEPVPEKSARYSYIKSYGDFNMKKKVRSKDKVGQSDNELAFLKFRQFKQFEKSLINDNKIIDSSDRIGFFDTSIENIPPILTMDELAFAINSICKKRGKVDVLIMLNCFMQNMDTLFALKNSVNYLIASPTIVVTELFDFYKVIPMVANTSNLLPVQLCEIIMDSLKGNSFLNDIGYSKKISVFTVNLEALLNANFFGLFKDISHLLFNHAKENSFLELIKAYSSEMNYLPLIDDEITDFQTFYFIDGLYFFKTLAHFSQLSQIHIAKIQKFIEVYDEFSGKKNETINHIGEMAANEGFNSSGFSLFFPFEKSHFEDCNYIKYFYNEFEGNPVLSAIAKHTMWDNFLFLYFKFLDEN